MNKFCVVCGKKLTGRQRKVCDSKECHRSREREYNHKWRQSNPEYDHNRYKDNSEKKKEYSRKYRQDNPGKIKEGSRNYYQDNREGILEKLYKYRQDNPEKIKEKNLKYYQEHRGEAREYSRKYYRLARGLPEDADLHKESSIECITREWLQENGVKFIKQYYINLRELGANWTHVDFFIEPNICLYSDGDYYHRPKDIQERDIKIDRALETEGYNVIRITETEILEGNRVWCKLIQYLSKYGVDMK